MLIVNDIITQLLSRRTYRSWEDTPVSDDDQLVMQQAVTRAPSAGNMALYSVIDIIDNQKKEQLAKLCDNQPMIARAPLLWLFAADYQKWVDYYEASGAVEVGKAKGIPYSPPGTGDLTISLCDALIAAQTAVTAADSLEIGSCYIGDILEHYEQVRDLLKLPRYVFPITMVCFGYPKGGWIPDDPEIPKHQAEDLFHVGTYQRKDAQELHTMFSEHDAYYRAHHRFGGDITNTGIYFYLKKHTSEFMKEMNRSTRVMLENWLRPAEPTTKSKRSSQVNGEDHN